MPDPTEYVYLIGSETSPLVKIGRTTDIVARLNAIQMMSPVKLAVLWYTKGGTWIETALHRHFKARRSHGEWFDFPAGDAVDQVLRTIVVVKKAYKAEQVFLANGHRVRPAHPTSRLGMQYAIRHADRNKLNKPHPEPEPFTIVRMPAIYRQVADTIRSDIESGIYPFGCQLSTAEEIAKTLGVNRSSVVQAFALLRQDGLISSRRGACVTVTFRGGGCDTRPERSQSVTERSTVSDVISP